MITIFVVVAIIVVVGIIKCLQAYIKHANNTTISCNSKQSKENCKNLQLLTWGLMFWNFFPSEIVEIDKNCKQFLIYAFFCILFLSHLIRFFAVCREKERSPLSLPMLIGIQNSGAENVSHRQT